MNIESIPLDRIRPASYNARRTMNPDRLRDLALSIRKDGVLQNLLVRRGSDLLLEVVAGSRRLAAVKMAVAWLREAGDERRAAELELVPVRILSEEEAENAEVIQLVENLQREDMSLRDEVEALVRLMDRGRSAGELAEALGLPERTVQKRVALHALPEAMWEALERHEVGLEVANLVAMLPGEETRARLAEEILRPETSDRPLDVEEAKSLMARRYVRSLDDVIWAMDWGGAGGVVPACQGCPHRARRGAGADGRMRWACLNLPCFAKKARLAWALEQSADDREVCLVWDECEAIFPADLDGAMHADSEWVDLASQVPSKYLGHFGNVTWREFLDGRTSGKIAETFLPRRAINPVTGRVHELLLWAALKLWLRTAPVAVPEAVEGKESDAEPDSGRGGEVHEAPSGGSVPAPESHAMAPEAAAAFGRLVEAAADAASAGFPWQDDMDLCRYIGPVMARGMSFVARGRWAEVMGVDPEADLVGAISQAFARAHPHLVQAWILAGALIAAGVESVDTAAGYLTTREGRDA